MRRDLVVAGSSDYSSIQEHAISNFLGLIRTINPKRLFLHNPPAHVHTQLERDLLTQVELFVYPVVSTATLIRLRDEFSERIVGQASVRDTLLAALYPLTRKRRSKPVVLIFYGPSGVGKTETAQLVNDLIGGKLLRKQFSMFQSDKFASYVFGGSHAEASFARDLLDRESGVILIDEFDKANSIFHSAFYELFDSGVFEDKNYRVNLGPSLIICTSNYSSEAEFSEALGEALFSRFDALVQFKSLTAVDTREVIDRLVAKRFASLAPDELSLIEVEQVKSALYPLSGKLSNVRKLGKTADEVISLMLVRAVLNRFQPNVAATTEEGLQSGG